MAIRRMFSKEVVFTDDFLDMPATAKMLYFMLGMWADDDGFVDSPKSIQRQCGATDDDMKVLIAKRYVVMFESGIIVIRHWHMNNYLRQDRYKETIHLEEKAYLNLHDNRYTLINDARCTTGIPTVATGKDSIGKDSIDNIPPYNPPIEEVVKDKTPVADYTEDFNEWWDTYPKRRKTAKKQCKQKYTTILNKNKDITPNTLLIALKVQKQSRDWTKNNGEYIPAPLTWLNQGRWEDEIYEGYSTDNWEYKITDEDRRESL